MFQLNKTALTVVTSYLAGSWTVIEFSNFFLERFYISNVWTDILVFLLLTMSPTVIVAAFVSGRTKIKRIFIPINVILSVVYGTILFTGQPLDSYANKVEILNENGQNETIRAIKNSYRVNVGVGVFTNKMDIDSLLWLEFGMNTLLAYDFDISDLILVPSLSFYSSDNIIQILEDPVNANLDYILLGSIKTNENDFIVNFTLNDNLGNVLLNDSIKNADIFELIDDFSDQILENIELPNHISRIKNLPLRTVTTESYPALKNYLLSANYRLHDQSRISYLQKSISYDSTFVFPFQSLAASIGGIATPEHTEMAIKIMERALPFRHKLSGPRQLSFLMHYYSYKDIGKAVELAEKTGELHPHNYEKLITTIDILRIDDSYYQDYKQFVIGIYDQLDDRQKYDFFEHSSFFGDEDVLDFIDKEILNDPLDVDWLFAKANYLYSIKRMEDAKNTLKKIELLAPEKEAFINRLSKSIDNFDMIDLSGNYRYILSTYVRKLCTNSFGVPFVLYSQWANNLTPFYIENRNLFFNEYQEHSILYNENDLIYGIGLKGHILYKQNEQIIRLENDIKERNFEIADMFIDELINDNPNHFYLNNYNEHIKFINSKVPVDSSVLGNYDENCKIVIENGKLWFFNPGHRDLGKTELLAVSDSKFQLMNNYDRQIEFVKADSLRKIIVWQYDPMKNSRSIESEHSHLPSL